MLQAIDSLEANAAFGSNSPPELEARQDQTAQVAFRFAVMYKYFSFCGNSEIMASRELGSDVQPAYCGFRRVYLGEKGVFLGSSSAAMVRGCLPPLQAPVMFLALRLDAHRLPGLKAARWSSTFSLTSLQDA